MSAAKLMAGLAGLVAAAAVGTAVWQHRIARAAAEELTAARAKRAALQARVAATEKKVPTAEQRAREAESDSGELLRAVEAVKTAQAPRPASANPPPARARTTVTVEAQGSKGPGPEEKERLAHERAYQQELARKRFEELKRKAKLDEEVLRAEPAKN